MNYTCPYCGNPTTITDPNQYDDWNKIYIKESVLGDVGLAVSAVTCPNQECNQFMLTTTLTGCKMIGGNWKRGDDIIVWKLLPESEAKVLPDYIPTGIVEDYLQACRIRNLSPKASATLARRCLQGMIRDFYGIKKARLVDEVEALKDIVDTDTWESIEAVRKVGNIGAHMEKDIDLIINVEPEEAQLLIGLIEQLIEDWYVVREGRKRRARDLKQLVQAKSEQKNQSVESEENDK